MCLQASQIFFENQNIFVFFQILDPMDETRCKLCPNGTLPDSEHLVCVELPEEYLHLNSYWAIGSITFAIIGIVLATGVLVVFIRYSDHVVSVTDFISLLLQTSDQLSFVLQKQWYSSCKSFRPRTLLRFTLRIADVLRAYISIDAKAKYFYLWSSRVHDWGLFQVWNSFVHHCIYRNIDVSKIIFRHVAEKKKFKSFLLFL